MGASACCQSSQQRPRLQLTSSTRASVLLPGTPPLPMPLFLRTGPLKMAPGLTTCVAGNAGLAEPVKSARSRRIFLTFRQRLKPCCSSSRPTLRPCVYGPRHLRRCHYRQHAVSGSAAPSAASSPGALPPHMPMRPEPRPVGGPPSRLCHFRCPSDSGATARARPRPRLPRKHLQVLRRHTLEKLLLFPAYAVRA